MTLSESSSIVSPEDMKGAKQAFSRLPVSSSNSPRVHRLQRHSEIASMQSSQNVGPELTETAAKPLSRIGVATEVSERIFFVTANGPTEWSYEGE